MSRQTKIRPKSEGILFVTIEAKELFQVATLLDLDFIRARNTENGIIDVFSKRTFHVPIINASRKTLYFLKHQRAVFANFPFFYVILSKLDEYCFYPINWPCTKKINFVHYKPTTDRLYQTQEHAQLMKEKENRLQEDRREEVAIFDGCPEHKVTPINMLLKFFAIQDGRLGRISIAQHQIELTSQNKRPVRRALYRAGLKSY